MSAPVRRDFIARHPALIAYHAKLDEYVALQMRIAAHRLRWGQHSFEPFFAHLRTLRLQLARLRIAAERMFPNYRF